MVDTGRFGGGDIEHERKRTYGHRLHVVIVGAHRGGKWHKGCTL